MKRLVVDDRDVAAVEMAVTARSRSKGLLGRSGLDGALWLSPARQVHTYRMRFAIDVAYVDKAGRVLHATTMRPGKLGPWSFRARGVLEAEAGAFERWGLAVGSRVSFVDDDAARAFERAAEVEVPEPRPESGQAEDPDRIRSGGRRTPA